ncbi:LuxR C-terminal-related transcriptional regulator [Sodalis endosymbiont of Spalangia cameroni]|uniref:helix-turn-helix transcriptional regulator n=1 Tax=Sodalis praecaptivus TaxID=1239307 RepID=UPI0031F7EDA3
MDDKITASSKTFMIESLSKLPIISFLEKSTLPWNIKDTESKHVYMNAACQDFLSIPSGFNFEDKKDEEFPCKWSEFSEEFKAQDRKAEEDKSVAEIISCSHYGKIPTLEPYFCPKFPLYNTCGEVLGTIYFAKKLNFVSVFDFFSNMKPSVITLTAPVDIFTERELEIIFFAVQRMPAKEIATKLFLSHRTVENRLLRIYEKIDVNSIHGLIEYCHNVGLDKYVPKKLLREGVNFCW